MLTVTEYQMPDLCKAVIQPGEYELVYSHPLGWTLRLNNGELALVVKESTVAYLMRAWKRQQPYPLPLP